MGAVVGDDDKLLLIRGGHWSAAGDWSVPGGRVRFGETVAEATVRELREETGLVGVCDELIGWVERVGDGFHFVILDFEVTLLNTGEPTAGDDVAEVAWVPLSEVGEYSLTEGLAEFLHEHGIIDTIA